MKNYICDTAKECGSETCNYRLSLPEHARLMPQLGFMCVKAGHRVYPEPVAPNQPQVYNWSPTETHTCYYCNHEGPCVNRIHSTEFTAWGRTQEIRYVCDDGIMCDGRWQALETDKEAESLEQKIYDIIDEEALNHVTNEKIAEDSTNRIMKLIELPF